ncbi:MAG: hypothetical protein L0287_03490, partial [Anaerolineae bacterium]|nr:hypothetical protein [Anaerolineae bacterium]
MENLSKLSANFRGSKIPIWINIVQILLTLILLTASYWFYFDHSTVLETGITITGVPDLNLIYEFAARTFTMVVISIFVILSQNPRYFLLLFLMNILRETQEGFIDPLFPVANAPISPIGDFIVHIIIVAIEIFAFITLYRINKKLDN